MGKINLLDKHVAELIAAGEVVERPASVVKELVENSIDADATIVTVEIKNGGCTYLRVTDNGSGIVREDVPTAFLRHATSKVHNQNDLDSITTLGFRGEALASVAAVSHVELLTRTQEELAGTSYTIEGGNEISCEDTGCAQGTTIIVRDIFYNTPARMKFLKKDTVESNAVAGIMDKIALSHPEVSIRFIKDGKECLRTPGDRKLISAIHSVYGKEFSSGLIPVEYELAGVHVWGFISKPSSARPNRSMQNFFINGRYIKSRTAMVALEEAFKGSIMVGKFPASVLHMQLSFETVDVNVHPAKMEIRFINERPVFEAVYHAVKTALNKGDRPSVIQLPKREFVPLEKEIKKTTAEQTENTVFTPESFKERMLQSVPPVIKNTYYPNINIECDDERPQLNSHVSSLPVHKELMSDRGSIVPYQRSSEISIKVEEEIIEKTPEQIMVESVLKKGFQLIGEAFGTYLILENGEKELVFIDKHAAHERILYEKLKKESGEAFSQLLLDPIVVTLPKEDYSAVLESLELFCSAGFELEDFGAGAVLIRSAPLSLEKEDIAASVMEIAGYLESCKTDITTEKLDWLYHNIACRAAIKGNDESTLQELVVLAQNLEQNPQIKYCPHGRPVSITLKKHDLEKQFGRIQ